MSDDPTPAEVLFDQVIDLRDAIRAFEKQHVELMSPADDFVVAATDALGDLAEILLRWDPDQEDDQ